MDEQTKARLSPRAREIFEVIEILANCEISYLDEKKRMEKQEHPERFRRVGEITADGKFKP